MDIERRNLITSIAVSFATLTICQQALAQKLIANAIHPSVIKWLNEVEDLTRSLKNGDVSQLQWKSMMEAFYSQVPLHELMRFIDFEKLVKNQKLKSIGETFQFMDLPKVEGFEKQTFYNAFVGFKKNNSLPPHGHNHQVSSFLVLRGELHARQFDRLKDEDDSLCLRPSIDRVFQKGEYATVSQEKDNVHWFTALKNHSYAIDFGFYGLDSAGSVEPLPHQSPTCTGRIFLNVDDRTAADGEFKASRISEEEAYRKYG